MSAPAGPTTAIGELELAPTPAPCGHGSAVVATRARPGGDGRNQDALAVIPVAEDRTVLLVVDGMGGAPSGDRAAERAVAAVLEALRSSDGTDVTAAILAGIDRANADVQSLNVGAGATLALADVQAATFRTYHVGDAGVYVVGQRGKEKWWTPSHSPVGYAVQAGVLDESDAMEHRDRHLVSNALGSPDMHIEVGPILPLGRRDTILVASDGVWDNFTLPELAERIRKGPLRKVATTLDAGLRERMAGAQPGVPAKPDDATFALYRPG